MTRVLKIATVWLLLGGLLFLGFTELERRKERTRFTMNAGAVEIRRSDDGHYHWPGRINGYAVDFLVDTGATRSAVSKALADDLGLKTEGRIQSNTANGKVVGSLAKVDIDLKGGLQAEQLRIVVLPGLGSKPLLGMDVLGRLSLQQRNGVLRVESGDAR